MTHIQSIMSVLADALRDAKKLPEDALIKTHDKPDAKVMLKIDDKYVNLDKLEVEKAELVKLTDIDLCIALDGEKNEEGLMTFDELHQLGIENNVVIELENERGESCWPTFSFDGLASNVAIVLERLGLDKDDIESWIEEAIYGQE